jgi:hypothetical protein
VGPRFATPLHCRHSAAFNGLLLDSSPPVTLWLNPSWYLLPQVFEKLRASRAKGILSHRPLLAASDMVSRSAAASVRALLTSVTASLRQTASSRHGRAFLQSRGATAGSGLRLCVKDGGHLGLSPAFFLKFWITRDESSSAIVSSAEGKKN